MTQMISFHVSCLVLLCAHHISLCGFSTGRIREGLYEYDDINGWMTPLEGAALCESDLKCAGFTYNGVYVEDEKFELYFFSFVLRIILHDKAGMNWLWTSYKVNRAYVLIPGVYLGLDTFTDSPVNLSIDITQEPDLAEMYCRQLDNCAGIVQYKESGMAYILDIVKFNLGFEDSIGTTLISLHADENQLMDNDAREFDRCCEEGPYYTNINIAGKNIPDMIERVECDISKEDFLRNFVRKRKPVLLQGCLNQSWFENPRNNPNQKFAELNFDKLLERLFNRGNDTSTAVSRPKLRRSLIDRMRENNFEITYPEAEELYKETYTSTEKLNSSESFTHDFTPNHVSHTYQELLEYRQEGSIRVFLKLSYLRSQLDCYQRFRIPGSHRMKNGYKKCLVLDGFWKPGPMPDDLYAITKYDNDLAWIIMSAMSTGSQLHVDPDHTGAWNLLLTGRKWWAVIPFETEPTEYSCDENCSGKSWQYASNAFPWFKNILPQIEKRRFYGKKIVQFVQVPGDVLYLPNGMPHTIFNIDDNVALTENYLFPDGLPKLVSSIAIDDISQFRPGWNQVAAYRTLYNRYTDSSDRKLMRKTYQHISRMLSNFENVCMPED